MSIVGSQFKEATLEHASGGLTAMTSNKINQPMSAKFRKPLTSWKKN